MIVRRISNDELYHHGVKGQRWGVRRYQNPDGTLTAQGQARLAKLRGNEIGKVQKRIDRNTENYNKKLQKMQKKIDVANAKGKEKKADKLTQERERVKKKYEIGKSIAEKEIKALKKYKLSDFAKEQHNITTEVGEAASQAAIASMIGTVTLAMIGLPYVMITRPGYDIGKRKTEMRLASLEKGEVRTLKAEAIENRLNNAKNEKQKTKFQEKLNEQLERDKRRYG